MSGDGVLIELAVVLAASIVAVWWLPRRIRHERRRWARYILNQRLQRMAADFEEMARKIGEAFIPAMRQAVAAIQQMAAALAPVAEQLKSDTPAGLGDTQHDH
jgi:hypothetical protein